MRISELSSTTGVSIATLKYYLREGLLPHGVSLSATQAEYSDVHVSRIRVIRALIESGVSIVEVRDILNSIDAPPENPIDLVAQAHAAVTPLSDDVCDLSRIEKLVSRMGWSEGMCDPELLKEAARALDTLEKLDFDVDSPILDTYLETARKIAEEEINGIPKTSYEDAIHYVVIGSVLIEPLLVNLRRIAEQIVSCEKWGQPNLEIFRRRRRRRS